jgi:hypothetical protein
MKQAKGEYPNHHYLGKLAAWTLSWLLTVALATFGPLLIWGTDQKIYSLLAILLSAGVGVGMLLANRKYLQSLDELQRRIQLEAMGVTLGVALVGGISYSMLDIVDLIPFDAEISFLVMSIGITYLVSVFVGQMRYK